MSHMFPYVLNSSAAFVRARLFPAVRASTSRGFYTLMSHTECGCQQQWSEGSTQAACLMGVEGRAMFRLCHPEDQLVGVRYVAFMSLALISCHLSGYSGLGGLVEVFVV